MKKIAIVIPAGDNTPIEGIGNINTKDITLIVERGKNPSENRNRGIKKAKTDLIAFVNAHTLLDKNWLKEVLIFFKKYPEIDIVGGPQLNHPNESFFAKSSGYALGSIFGAAGNIARYKKAGVKFNVDESFLTSANLICRKRIFKKVKFDESLYPGEDPKFIEDAIKSGFKVAYSSDIIVYNLRRQNLCLLFKQIFNYGLTRPKKESILKTIRKPYFLAPSLFVLYLILLPSLLLISGYFIWPLIAYLILDILFSFYDSIKNKNILSIPLLLAIFPIIHISYGLGFIFGNIQKIWKK